MKQFDQFFFVIRVNPKNAEIKLFPNESVWNLWPVVDDVFRKDNFILIYENELLSSKFSVANFNNKN